jgi:hypothetical protein
MQERKGNEKSRKSACLYIAPNPQLKQEGPHDQWRLPLLSSSSMLIHPQESTTKQKLQKNRKKEKKKKKEKR